MAEKGETFSSAKSQINKFDDPNDPLYLHHSDQPGLILVTQQLNEENYNTWSRAMLMALNIKNKSGFVDGTVKQPPKTSIAELQQWKRCNDLVRAWIFNSISQDIGASIIYNEDSHEIWKDLKERFSSTNSVHLFHIEEAIHNCKQEGMTIGAYYTKLKGLWDERDALSCIPTCNCGAVKEVLLFQQNQKTMKFLMGLNEIYAGARGQILLMDPVPSVNKAYSLILQDEKQRGVSKGGVSTIETSAFAARSSPRNFDRNSMPKNPHLKCELCDRIGHTSDTCRAHLKCDYCGWQGHTIYVCRKRQKANISGNKSDHKERKYYSSKANHADSSGAPFTLTSQQYENLISLLNGSKSNSTANHVGTTYAISDISGMWTYRMEPLLL
ncbi:hypothetical protein BUALT_Bualt17G0031900 [Buddleja alternifolia]|uniref:Retrotransposon Copia-like N-terminal domain-containing protein n=1 Tax=Buddleja alternifolia TaxID=168488 RepID=A0AAV6WBZ5_9LAMI|nr:hypothetical protein BUALT_Bualt17G0031900 [Buddleja alternifolia]